MTIKFKLSDKNMREFFFLYYTRNGSGISFAVYSILLIIVGMCGIWRWFTYQPVQGEVIYGWLMFGLLAFLIIFIKCCYIKRDFNSNCQSFKENDITVILSDDFIEISLGEDEKGLFKYSTVTKYFRYKDCFYIIVGRNQDTMIIPVSAFADDGEVERFLGILREKTGKEIEA